jgi:Bacterial Ig-like domain (group 3)/FG-GAP-like repeat
LVVAEVGVIHGLSGYVAAVLLGNGDGTFQPAVLYFSGGCGALAVAVADVNSDGKPDIFIGNASLGSGPTGCSGGDGVVSVLLGNGDGTFQPATTYDTGGPEAFSVGVGDINGDGHPDLVVADFLSGGVGVLLGDGDGTFQPVTTFSSGPNGARSVVVVDVNGDHRPDVVAANPCCTGVANHGLVGVLLNNTGPHSPTTTELTSNLNPAPPQKMVAYTATVIPQSGQANGTVTFQDGGSTIATVTLAGNKAAYSTSYKGIGVHLITAAYSGDLHNDSSTSSTLTEDIQGASKTVLASSGSPSFIGQTVTFTATVTSKFGNIPDGELVTFYDRATKIGTGPTANGMATLATSSLSANTHSIKAKYPGDAIFKLSSGTVRQIVNKYPTTATLSSSPNPSAHGRTVTFTATVTSGGPTPTGEVKFLDGTKSLGSKTLSGGVAKLTNSTLAVGTHPITAQYVGDAASDKSTSPVVNQVVQ